MVQNSVTLSYTIKINSKWMKDLNVRTGNHQNSTGQNRLQPLWPRLQQFLTWHVSKGKGNKSKKINYWDLIKIKSFCTAKEIINKNKRQPMEWENIFANDILDKGLVPWSIKNLPNSTPKYKNNLVKKWAKDMNRHFSKENIQMANRHIKRCSISQRKTNQNHN